MVSEDTTLASSSKPIRKVPLQTIERLSLYRKVLEELHENGTEYVYSHRLSELAGVSPAQLRRDLSIFGNFGNISKGYGVFQLIVTIAQLLGSNVLQNVALVGMGNLGRAILSYRGFDERGFHVGVLFDIDRDKAGRIFAGRRCYHIDDLERVIPEYDVKIAILASKPQGLQEIVDRLGQAGVRSILNFVPKRLVCPPNVFIEEIDISSKLEKLSFLSRHGIP